MRVVLCEDCPYNLLKCFRSFHSFCNHEVFVKLSLPFSVLVHGIATFLAHSVYLLTSSFCDIIYLCDVIF